MLNSGIFFVLCLFGFSFNAKRIMLIDSFWPTRLCAWHIFRISFSGSFVCFFFCVSATKAMTIYFGWFYSEKSHCNAIAWAEYSIHIIIEIFGDVIENEMFNKVRIHSHSTSFTFFYWFMALLISVARNACNEPSNKTYAL